MSAGVETRETTRGADSGPPSAVGSKETPPEPRLGPLPEPGLFERLRASWSLAALVPAFDPRGLRRREWRPAAALALLVHAAMLVAIVVISKYALARFGEQPRVYSWVGPTKVTDAEPPRADDSSAPPADGHESGGAPGGGGSNEGPKPVTAGATPRTTPNPILPPTITPPLTSVSLPVPEAAKGPEIAVAPVGPVGLPDAPPAPDGPSLGNAGGDGVGTNPGDGAGRGTREGTGDGPGGPGGGGDRPGGQRPGVQTGVGQDPNGVGTAVAGVRDHGPKIAYKVKPKPTPAMIENGTDGTVTVRVTIGADGSLLSFEPVQTVANGGTQAALTALKSCRFLPAVRGGKYVTETTLVVFDFRKN